jgi:hypothetical protein
MIWANRTSSETGLLDFFPEVTYFYFQVLCSSEAGAFMQHEALLCSGCLGDGVVLHKPPERKLLLAGHFQCLQSSSIRYCSPKVFCLLLPGPTPALCLSLVVTLQLSVSLVCSLREERLIYFRVCSFRVDNFTELD